jgi:hypothetical protein
MNNKYIRIEDEYDMKLLNIENKQETRKLNESLVNIYSPNNSTKKFDLIKNTGKDKNMDTIISAVRNRKKENEEKNAKYKQLMQKKKFFFFIYCIYTII